jgi:hypothetical protein
MGKIANHPALSNRAHGHDLPPPKTLKAEGRALWLRLQPEYQIVDSGGLTLLQLAAEARDLQCESLAIARRDGFVTTDKYGQRRPHPMLTVSRDAGSAVLRALRQLHLDVEPLNDRVGRPPGGR